MPTENRSSNTENAPCPFCGGQVDPEGWLRGDGVRGPECESCGATAPNLALWNGAHPAQQDKGDAVWYEHAMRDEKGRPFQFQVTRDKEPAFGKADVDYDRLYSVTVDPLYKHADPAELERLRKELLRWKGIAETLQVDAAKLSDDGVEFMTRAKRAEADLERLQRRIQNADLALKAQTQNCDTLRAQLAEAHALLDEAYQHDIGTALKRKMRALHDALSASAEPSAPVMQIPDGYCVMPRQIAAGNGAKALLLGEFKLEVTRECPECAELEEPAEGCEICDGEGEYGQRHVIPWDKIKFIYSEAVKGLALKQ